MESSNDWTDAERRVERAAELFEQRKLNEALAELQLAVHVNPYNPNWLFNLALTLDEMGRCDEAIDAYRAALELEPADVSTLYRLGATLQRAGRFREAVAAFDDLERIEPDYEPVYCARIACYSELGEHQHAEEMFYLGQQVKENCPTCYFNIGLSLAARQNWDRAIYCWQRTLELEPTHPAVHQRLAEAFRQRGDRSRARKHLLSRLRQAPRDYAVLAEYCQLSLELGRIEEVGARLAAISTANSAGSAHVQFARGIWLAAQNQFAAALESFTRTLELDPTFPRAHLRISQIHLAQRQTIAAKTHLRSELMLRPDDPQTLRDLANLLIDTGETRSAITCLRRLVLICPNDVPAWQNLAVAHFLRHQFDAGITACRKALEISPGHLASTHNLAMALGELQRYDEALLVLADAPQCKDELGELLLRLRARKLKAKVRGFLRRIVGLG